MYRHIIVYWVDEESYSVSTENFVLDKACLADSSIVGRVEHGDANKKTPKDGWQVFNARVLAVSENLDEILLKERELQSDLKTRRMSRDEISEIRTSKKSKKIQEKKSEERSKKRKKLFPVGVENTPKRICMKSPTVDSVNKKKTMAEIMVLEGDVVQRSFTLLTKKDEEIAILKAQNAQLMSDNVELLTLRRLNMQLQEKMLNSAFRKRSTSSSSVPSPKSVPPPPLECRPTSDASSIINVQTSVPSVATESSAMKIYNYISIEQAKQTIEQDYKKTTCNLVSVIFTLEEILTSSVTGRNTSKTSESHPALDANKTEAVIEYVQHSYPVDRALIKAKMGQKLKDARIQANRLRKRTQQVEATILASPVATV